MSPTEVEIAWAAGLFEGEGTFANNRTYTRADGVQPVFVMASLLSTDRDVLERFHRIIGVGAIHDVKTKKDHHLQAWRWCVGSIAGVEHVIDLLLPHLGERRRARAISVLDAYHASPVKRRIKGHCPNGHAYTRENLLVGKSKRRCRQCLTEGIQRWAKSRKAKEATLVG